MKTKWKRCRLLFASKSEQATLNSEWLKRTARLRANSETGRDVEQRSRALQLCVRVDSERERERGDLKVQSSSLTGATSVFGNVLLESERLLWRGVIERVRAQTEALQVKGA